MQTSGILFLIVVVISSCLVFLTCVARMGNAASLATENEVIVQNCDDDDNDLPTDIYDKSTRQIPVYNAASSLEEGINASPLSSPPSPTNSDSSEKKTRKESQNDDNGDSDDDDDSDDVRNKIEDFINNDDDDAGTEEDFFEKLSNETLQTERDSMRKRSDEGEEEMVFIHPTSDNDDEYENLPLEFMQTYEKDVFFVRRYQCPSSTFVVAKRDTPLVLFCQHIYVLQIHEDKLIRSLNPSSMPSNATDAEISKSIPGILARVVSDVLYETPQFAVPLEDGNEVKVVGNASDPVADRPENIDISLGVAPIQIIDPLDFDYKERIAAAEKMQTTNTSENLLQKIDEKVNKNQLKPFVTTGNRLPFDAKPSPGFTEMSPVQEGEQWMVINRQFHCMWKAFERTCWGNGNFLMDVNVRLSSIPENTYFFGVDIGGAEEVSYSAKQEHSVLEKLFTTYRKTIDLESLICNKHAVVRNLCDAVSSKLDASTLSTITNAIGKEATVKQSEALKNLADAENLLRTLDRIHKELDELRGTRSFLIQQ